MGDGSATVTIWVRQGAVVAGASSGATQIVGGAVTRGRGSGGHWGHERGQPVPVTVGADTRGKGGAVGAVGAGVGGACIALGSGGDAGHAVVAGLSATGREHL